MLWALHLPRVGHVGFRSGSMDGALLRARTDITFDYNLDMAKHGSALFLLYNKGYMYIRLHFKALLFDL